MGFPYEGKAYDKATFICGYPQQYEIKWKKAGKRFVCIWRWRLPRGKWSKWITV
jgi:hypothetical protein